MIVGFCLAGTNSYVLFTLDKLIYKLVKQFQSLLADDLAQVAFTLPRHNSIMSRKGLCNKLFDCIA